jgi:subtilase family serine protease
MRPIAHTWSLAAALPLLLASFSAENPAQVPARDGARFVPIAGMELLAARDRAQDVGPAPAEQVLSIAVSLPFAQPDAMQAFVDAVSDPHSPQYRQFVTPAEVGARFGLPESASQGIAQYLVQNGFEVTLVAQNRLAILAHGTVAQAERAFHTTLRSYTLSPENEYEPASFIACSSAVQLPSDIAPYVIDVAGLETFTRPHPLATLLTPSLTRGLYGLSNMFSLGYTGAGRTVGVSNFDGFRANDWLLYIAHFALPTPVGGAGTNVTVVPCNGGGIGAGAAGGEGDLDIQMALGMAPLASIRIYDSDPTSNLISVLTTEVTQNLCDTITESYGWILPAATLNSAHNLHLSGNAQGITYMAASGDSGTAIGNFDYPVIDPEVLVVGGTVATVSSPSGARVSEVGWSGSGGGWTTHNVAFNNVRPSWQVGTGVPAVNAFNNHRLVPDVGFHAAGVGTGAYQFYSHNALQSSAIGTSFSSPMLAGSLAVAEQYIIALGGLTPDGMGNQRFGRIQDLLYGLNGDTTAWYDIVTGSNGSLPSGQGTSSAGLGWDTVTGWGALKFDGFVPLAACLTGAPCGGTPFCFGDSFDPLVTTPCPCSHFGGVGRGCANFSNPQGAQLTATGLISLDNVQLISTGEPATSLGVFMQCTGNNVTGAVFGDGLRCATGTLKRLYTKSAVGGSATAPVIGEFQITVRSANLGDSILPGTPRYYQRYYRDNHPLFCTGLGFNVTNAVRVDW